MALFALGTRDANRRVSIRSTPCASRRPVIVTFTSLSPMALTSMSTACSSEISGGLAACLYDGATRVENRTSVGPMRPMIRQANGGERESP